MIRRPPIYNLTVTPYPATTPVRSASSSTTVLERSNRQSLPAASGSASRPSAAAGRTEPTGIGSLPGEATNQQSAPRQRSEEHTSELQSLMRTSYAVLCLQNTQECKSVTT